ncbi:FtsH protease activity modulator HflK [bacterium]|nr:FtsH protease activity modulator HflK [bacterium]
MDIQTKIGSEKSGFSGHLLLWGKCLIGLAAFIYILSGFYRIKTYETGVLRLFGRVINDHVGPGLHYAIPYPFTRIDKLRPQERKRVAVGFEFSDQVIGMGGNPVQGEFLSGDENILNIEMVLQYFIVSPVEYLFRVYDPETVIKSFAKTNLTKIISQMEVDEIFKGSGKVLIQSGVLKKTQDDLDRILDNQKWVQITSVNLQNVSPPLEVADAFKDVVTARQDRDRLINEAEGYRYDALPRARGKAEELVQQAGIYRQDKIDLSRGDAERFLRMAEEYAQKGSVTSMRLYLETMEKVMERIHKVFVQKTKDQKPLDLSIIDLED